MFGKKNSRKRLLADLKIQGTLCLRVAIYWIACQTAVIATIFAIFVLEGFVPTGGSPARYFIPAIFVSFLVLPIVLLDMLVFSNRFAGPMLNLRRKLAQMANGEDVSKVKFRPGDMFDDISANYNKIRERMIELKHSSESQENASQSVLMDGPATVPKIDIPGAEPIVTR